MARSPKRTPVGNRPDLLSGGLFIAVGALGLWAGRGLDMGTAAAMGPGYLPFAVSVFIVAIGLAITAMSFMAPREDVAAVRVRPVFIITAAIAGFAYLAEHLGFAVASAWLIGAASLADRDTRLVEVLISIVGLTLFGAGVFIVGLGVQIRLWPF